ncbi:glycine cleavage system aminomethyltransferase GcvT [Aeoliella mucimassa]|uniref:Aminomethyltransferase n=1 Tax=Aeoliella mucimassa TaxID=2527972 RepID=A0A518AIW6_9BACT|nr:glycine cleavage system aminomethyltransferase GcvT [Aeoliella mucimassa]QDU54614.1 Glycine cleavage system T protein [Aeoliella mucimassa]
MRYYLPAPILVPDLRQGNLAMSTGSSLAQTPLHDWHATHGGRMVDFAGFSMPVQYASIVDEHNATRTRAGLFDISHMGRLAIRGPEAAKFLDAMVTRRIIDMKPGQIRYGLVCNAAGGILDDVLVYRWDGELQSMPQPPEFHMVVNASNREKILAWLKDRETEFAARVEDLTTSTAMIALQGPEAIEKADPLVFAELTSLRYYRGIASQVLGHDCYVSRTGYTGEDGCEIICPAEDALEVWQTLYDAISETGGMAVGLGARDTLRLEAGMPLYGHELSENITPWQAGLEFAVNLKDREFIGSEVLAGSMDGSRPVRVGLQMDGRRAAREGCPVMYEDEPVGTVTSGTYSPTFERPLAMAYVKPVAAAIGTPLAVDIRGTQIPATVVPLPFYERGK